jgi:hypothetical protein
MRAAQIGIIAFVTSGLCFVGAPVAAQTAVGAKGGITVATFATVPDNAGGLTNHIDWSAGVFVVPNANAKVTAQIEALFSRRGAKLDGDVFGFGLGDIRLTYLDLSGLVRLRAGGSDLGAYVIAGPTIGIKIDAEFVVVGFSPSIDGAFKDTEVGLTLGAGVEGGRYLVEGRYMHGLTNIVKGIDIVGLSAKSRVFAVLAGVRF